MRLRRTFLKLLALAPIAASASAKALSSSAPLDSDVALRQFIRDEAGAIDVVGTYPRGNSPTVIACDEFGRPFHHSSELQALIEASRKRHHAANLRAYQGLEDALKQYRVHAT